MQFRQKSQVYLKVVLFNKKSWEDKTDMELKQKSEIGVKIINRNQFKQILKNNQRRNKLNSLLLSLIKNLLLICRFLISTLKQEKNYWKVKTKNNLKILLKQYNLFVHIIHIGKQIFDYSLFFLQIIQIIGNFTSLTIFINLQRQEKCLTISRQNKSYLVIDDIQIQFFYTPLNLEVNAKYRIYQFGMSFLMASFQKVCQKDNYVLYAKLSSDGGLKLRILQIVSYIQTIQFDLFISSFKNYETIVHYCQTVQNFVELLRDPNNIIFDPQKSMLSIFDHNRFGKNIQLITFRFDSSKTITTNANEFLSAKILPKLYSDVDLTLAQTKEILKCVSQCIFWSLGEIKVLNYEKNQENKNWRKQLDILRDQMNQNLMKTKSLNKVQPQFQFFQQEIRNKIAELSEQIKKIKIYLKIDEMPSKIKQELSLFPAYDMLQRFNRTEQKLVIFSKQAEASFSKIFDRLNNIYFNFQLLDKYWPLTSVSFLDNTYPNNKNVQIVRNTIKNTSFHANDRIHLFGHLILKDIHMFAFKFITIGEFVDVGIVDLNYKKKGRIQENYIVYDNSGYCYVGFNRPFQDKTLGFKEGDILQMKLDITKGTIEWSVGNEIRKRIQGYHMIRDKTINWIPFVCLHKKGDEFRIY